jgi:serine/threonine-protein kinase
VRDVVEDCLRRRTAGERLSDEEVIAGHPGLMPELGEELRKLRVIGQAVEPSTAPEEKRPADRGQGPSAPPPDIPSYELLQQVGSGSFGEVWLGCNRHTGQFCAVKVIPRSQGVELEGIRAYKRRARGHANLLPVDHIGEAGPFLYYTMPLADDAKGSVEVRRPEDYEPLTLNRHLRRHAPLPVEEVRALADQLLAGLEHLHAADLLHKDVKPGNVLRVRGTWCLGDMGLTTPSDQPRPDRGTPQFWPPEGPCDQTADLYALGKVLYLVLTRKGLDDFPRFADGSLCIPGDDPRAGPLRQVILRACHDDPSARFPTAAAMRRALASLPAPPGPLRRWRRHLLAAGLGVAGLALAAALAVLLWPAPSAPLVVRGLEVDHYARVGRSDQHRGLLGVKGFSARKGDAVTVRGELSGPAYCYLIAYRTDGTEELCFPEDEGVPPPRTDRPRYPSVKPEDTYGLDEGEGLMAFALVVSRRPLPAYAEWRKQRGDSPWRKAEAQRDVVWRYDGRELLAVTADEPGGTRAKGRRLGDAGPLAELLGWLREAREVETVAAVAFPVLPAEGE